MVKISLIGPHAPLCFSFAPLASLCPLKLGVLFPLHLSLFLLSCIPIATLRASSMGAAWGKKTHSPFLNGSPKTCCLWGRKGYASLGELVRLEFQSKLRQLWL